MYDFRIFLNSRSTGTHETNTLFVIYLSLESSNNDMYIHVSQIRGDQEGHWYCQHTWAKGHWKNGEVVFWAIGAHEPIIKNAYNFLLVHPGILCSYTNFRKKNILCGMYKKDKKENVTWMWLVMLEHQNMSFYMKHNFYFIFTNTCVRT
jgi:hypothetical protein